MDNRESEGLVKGDGTECGGLWSGRGLSEGVGVLGSLSRAEAQSLQRVVSADTGGAEEETEAAEDPREPGAPLREGKSALEVGPGQKC